MEAQNHSGSTMTKIDSVREASLIESVVGEYTQLCKEGRLLVSLRPLHTETSPGFTPYLETQGYNCFGSAGGGYPGAALDCSICGLAKPVVAIIAGGTVNASKFVSVLNCVIIYVIHIINADLRHKLHRHREAWGKELKNDSKISALQGIENTW